MLVSVAKYFCLEQASSSPHSEVFGMAKFVVSSNKARELSA